MNVKVLNKSEHPLPINVGKRAMTVRSSSKTRNNIPSSFGTNKVATTSPKFLENIYLTAHGNILYQSFIEVIKKYPTKLTPYELTEIANFPRIYYFGIKARKRNNKHASRNYDYYKYFYRI